MIRYSYQVILFAAQHVLPENGESKRGYILIKLIRSYIELDMYAGLTVHTDSTIAAGEAELQTFGTTLRVYNLYYLAIALSHSH